MSLFKIHIHTKISIYIRKQTPAFPKIPIILRLKDNAVADRNLFIGVKLCTFINRKQQLPNEEQILRHPHMLISMHGHGRERS